MLAVKRGVQPPLVYILAAVANVAQNFGIEITITSASDGRHSQWSGHHQLRSLDVRSHDMRGPQAVADAIDQELRVLAETAKWLVLLENEGMPNEHIHIQLTP